MTLEVLGVDDMFEGVVCLGFCLVCLCCPRGFGINVLGVCEVYGICVLLWVGNF